jgi:NAD(P)-dependent dehydrogenase (short-subunit alcohol dehydrogenase family)
MLAIQLGAPDMIKRGKGAIVCTASVAGLRNGAGSPAYSASKAGVISLVSLAANNLAGTNVRVNGICPGLIETGMTQPIFDRAREKGTDDRIGQLNPLRRAGQPEEIAKGRAFPRQRRCELCQRTGAAGGRWTVVVAAGRPAEALKRLINQGLPARACVTAKG